MSPRRTLEEALETRERVLDAAFRTTRGGGGRFTVDAVAKEAGVSKGAVLHHFPSKEALAVGMLERQLNEFDGLIERHLAEEPEGKPGRWLRAYVRASFEVGAGSGGQRRATRGHGDRTGPSLVVRGEVRVLAPAGGGRRGGPDQGEPGEAGG